VKEERSRFSDVLEKSRKHVEALTKEKDELKI
jgi:hypothetical protein